MSCPGDHEVTQNGGGRPLGLPWPWIFHCWLNDILDCCNFWVMLARRHYTLYRSDRTVDDEQISGVTYRPQNTTIYTRSLQADLHRSHITPTHVLWPNQTSRHTVTYCMGGYDWTRQHADDAVTKAYRDVRRRELFYSAAVCYVTFCFANVVFRTSERIFTKHMTCIGR